MFFVVLKIISEILIVLIPIFLSLPKKWLYFDFLDKFRIDYSIQLVVMLSIFIVLRYVFENKIANYKKQIEKLKHTLMAYQQFIVVSIEDLLKDMFIQLELSENDRISFFLYSSSVNRFYFSGRYSSAPKYNKQGRAVIENEGEYVFRVLNEESEKHYKNAPSIKNGYTKKRVMESSSMYGVPVWDNENNLKIGVVIFQSMKDSAYRSKEKRKQLQEQTKKVEGLINSMKINPSILPTDSKPLKGL